MKKTTWHRVKAPTRWYSEAGDELVGTYLRSETRTGQYGDYKVHYVKVRSATYYVSGATTNDLFALIPEGSKVKIVYLGTKLSQEGYEYKVYELYTEEAIELKIAV